MTLLSSKRRSSTFLLVARGFPDAVRLCVPGKAPGRGDGPLLDSERSLLKLLLAWVETRGRSSPWPLARDDARGAPDAMLAGYI